MAPYWPVASRLRRPWAMTKVSVDRRPGLDDDLAGLELPRA